MSRKVYSRTLSGNFLRVKSRYPEILGLCDSWSSPPPPWPSWPSSMHFSPTSSWWRDQVTLGRLDMGSVCVALVTPFFWVALLPPMVIHHPHTDGQHVDQDDHHHIKDQQLWSIGVVHLCCCSSVGWEHSASGHLRSLFLNTSASVRQDFKKKCYFEMC